MANLFGISITSEEQIPFLPFPDLAAVELPGEIVEKRTLKLPPSMPCIVRDLCDPRILAELPGCSFGIRMDFYRMIESRCQASARHNGCTVTFSLPVERVLRDADYAGKMRELLLGCWGICERFHLVPALEVRLPGVLPEQLTGWQKFQRNLLYPVRTLWALHPHEPGGVETAEKLPGNFRFDRDLWRIEFDAASGNYLSGKLLKRLENCALSVGGNAALILLAPGKNADQEDYRRLSQNVQGMENAL